MNYPEDHYFESPITSTLAIASMAGYACETYFVNRCSGSVFIKDRSGIITEIPPSNAQVPASYPSGALVIHQVHRGAQKTVDSWQAQYAQSDPSFRSPCMLAKAQMPHTVRSSKQYYQSEGVVSYKVDLAGAFINPQVKYIHEFDLLVMAGISLEEAMREPHPFSKIGEVSLHAYSAASDSSVYLKILYVENTGKQESLWTIINGKIQKVHSCVDHRYRDGLYVLYPSKHTSAKGSLSADGFASIDEANAADNGIKFFPSEAHALLHLKECDSAVQQARLEEVYAKQRIAETSYLKAKKESDNIERKAIEDEKRHVQAIAELQAEADKLREEVITRRIESGRKNTLDLIKYVPAIMTALAGISALLRKK